MEALTPPQPRTEPALFFKTRNIDVSAICPLSPPPGEGSDLCSVGIRFCQLHPLQPLHLLGLLLHLLLLLPPREAILQVPVSQALPGTPNNPEGAPLVALDLPHQSQSRVTCPAGEPALGSLTKRLSERLNHSENQKTDMETEENKSHHYF